MLFNSLPFIFIFLPLSLWSFFYLSKKNQTYGLGVLFVASLVFYGWHNANNVLLLFFSIITNFCVGKCIIEAEPEISKKHWLIVGLVFNLSLLAYFKYFNFMIENVNLCTGAGLQKRDIALPIGISFFTFTQIAFLVDTYRGLVKKYHVLNYALFVTYFPHLIAGPIIHHKEVMPQFEKKKIFSFSYRSFCIGMSIFSIGLFKKVMLADQLATAVAPVFDFPLQDLPALDAWIAAVSYTLELYFDFSGYSDMAIGLSMLLGIKLPINFYSPYKSHNIIEFWRRWNMTLSRFLRDYLYIPLGGNRKGSGRRYVNLMLTMLLGGLWHGANWTFIVWGFLHGFYLCVNHFWNMVKASLGFEKRGNVMSRKLSCLVTFLFVIIAWVFFRAPDFNAGQEIIYAMFFKPLVLPGYWSLPDSLTSILSSLHIGFTETSTWASYNPVANFHAIEMILVGLFIVWVMPNTYQVVQRYHAALSPFKEKAIRWFAWRPNLVWGTVMSLTLVVDIIFLQTSSVFLYFNF